MKNVIFEILDNEGNIKEQYEFKSLREASRSDKFKSIEYFALREIYLFYSNKRKAKHHDLIRNLIPKLRITEKSIQIPF